MTGGEDALRLAIEDAIWHTTYNVPKPTTEHSSDRYWLNVTTDAVLDAIKDAGHAIVPDEPRHFVTFDEGGWFIEHSVACRVAGTIGTCEYNAAIREIAEDFDPDDDPDQLGRWWITAIDSEGLPALERVHAPHEATP